jgi:hypothetical protein
MKIKHRSVALMLVSLFLFSGVAEAASTVTGVRSINNQQREIDYKITTDRLSEQGKKLVAASNSKEVIQDNIERNSNNLTIPRSESAEGQGVFSSQNFKPLTTSLSDKELNWLIEHNIVSRDPEVTIKASGVTVGKQPVLYDRNEPNVSVTRSDFLMGAYKALYGVIESRPLVFNISSWREASEIYYTQDEDGNREKKYRPRERQVVSETGHEYAYTPYGAQEDVEREFPEGDYYSYVSPNVYELYLKELVDKKIIDMSNIKDLRFKEGYEKIQVSSSKGSNIYPLWYNGLAPFMAMAGKDQPNDLVDYLSSSRVLGKSYNITGIADGSSRGSANKGSTVVIDKTTPNYFVNEAVDSMTALKYVESMLRLTEKDMTDTEAKIVTYKYGANYLDGLTDADRKTVMFLTAKGILNFEDPTEYRNLYGNLTVEFSYKLLYRLANKEARTKFSEIQLTDSDNFWLQKGFSQLQVSINSEKVEETTQLKDESGSYSVSPIPEAETEAVDLIESSTAKPQASIEESRWFGFKVYTKKTNFAAPAVTSPNQYEIKKVFDDYRKYKYKGVLMTSKEFNKSKFPELISATVPAGAKSKYQWEVKFKVNASNATTALRTVDGNLQVATDSLFSTKYITAVTKYTDSGQEVVLVPASSFKNIKSDIVIMEDKLLKNKRTGAMAILLQDKNIALVGSHVIQTEDVMVSSVGGEIYYNLDVIKMLMSNAYISSLDPNSLYLTKNIYDEHLAPVLGSTGNKIASTYVAKFKGKFAGGGDVGAAAPTVTSEFVNISQLTSASNFLIRTFSKKDESGKGEDMKFTLILHLVYKMPDKNTSFTAPLYSNPNPSLKEVNKFLFERPEDKQLADWWDNNLELSNAFANIIYGTSGTRYIKSGYLVPNVTVLYDKDNVVSSGFLGSIFKQVGAEIPSSWVTRFMGSTQTYNTIPQGNGKYVDAGNGSSFYYPVPDNFPQKEYPLWVYAMFNNSQGKTSENMGMVPESGGSKYKNGTLWRYLMGDRRLDVEQGTGDVAQGSRSYNTGDSVYVVTKNDAVYRMVDPTDGNFPVSYDGSVKIKTRTAENKRDYWEKSYVTAGGYKFYVDSISGNKITLIDTNVISGTAISTTKRGKTFYEIKGNVSFANGNKGSVSSNAIESRYNILRTIFSPISLSAQNYDKAMVPFKDSDGVTGQLPSGAMQKAIYFLDSATKGYGVQSTPFKDFNASNRSASYTLEQVKGKTVNAHVKFVIDSNYWSVTDGGVLVSRKTSPYLQVGNVYFSGLNQGLIDSMISKNVGTVDPNTLENGSKLIVGDMEFVKSGDYFVSQPQTNLTSWQKVVRDATNADTVKNAVSKMFTGYVVKVSNQDIPLLAFIKNPALGVPITGMVLNKTLIGNESSSSGAFIATSDKTGAYSKTSYSNKKVPVLKSVIFRISLDKNLLARVIDKDTKTYQLLLSTNTLSEGYIDNVPFFDESLSLGEKDDMFLMLNKSNFNVLSKSADLKQEFLNMYEQAFRGDLISFIRLSLCYFLSYLIIISWICFAIVNYKIGYTILDLIKNPIRGSDRKGVDVIRLISLRMYNLDTPIPIYRLVISNLIMFIIIYVLLDVIKSGGA